MALSVFSKFYFGFEVTEENCNLDFKEGSVKRRAQLEIKKYTLTEYVVALTAALNQAGTQVYTVTVNRFTRLITISATSNFSLLIDTGDYKHASAFELTGFTQGADLEGSNSYTGEIGAGKEYVPQVELQSYVPFSNNKRLIDPTKKTTATGETELIHFGVNRFMSCEIVFITNIPQPSNGPIRSNPMGQEDVLALLEYAISAADIEFMEDESRPDEFEKITLESTEEDQSGVGFRLIEDYDEGFPEYFRTGRLVWRQRT